MTNDEQEPKLTQEGYNLLMEEFPPQNKGCLQCGSTLMITSNRKYDGTTLGYCNKICKKDMEKKLMNVEGLDSKEAGYALEEMPKKNGYTFCDADGNPIKRS